MHANIHNIILTLGIVVLLGAFASANADPIVDGRYDPAEGYSSGHQPKFTVEKSDITVTGGAFWVHQNAATGDVSVYFSQPLTLVDNTYGDNSIGWGKGVAPSGKNHNFKDLVGSDKAQFVFTDALGGVVLDITMDYIHETSKNSGIFVCPGVTGGEGVVSVGSADSVLAWGSSLDYNFNVLGHALTRNSPQTDINYTENPNYAGWIFEVAYELRIAGGAFGTEGFGGVSIPVVHDSPNKIGKNKVYPEVYEPGTMLLICGGGIGILMRRRSPLK